MGREGGMGGREAVWGVVYIGIVWCEGLYML